MKRKSQIDIDRVRYAIEAAEQQTSAEIVVSFAPFFIGRVWEAARRAFVRLGIMRTRLRNGVLVFVVPSRRQVVVLADDAALEKVDPAVWRDAASRVAAAFARGEGTMGLIEAIDRLAGVLRVAFPRGPLDVNQLPDQPDLHP